MYKTTMPILLKSSQLFLDMLDFMGKVKVKPFDSDSVNLTKLFRGSSLDSFYKLNKAQQDAAIGSLTTNNFYMIHGPPGTGKSQTLTVILEALA